MWWLWHYWPRNNVVVRAGQHKLVDTSACVNSRPCGQNNTSKLGILVGMIDGAVTSHLDPRSGTGYYFLVWCWVWIAVAAVAAGASSLPSRFSHQLLSLPSSNEWRRTGDMRPSFEVSSLSTLCFFFFLEMSRERIPGSLFRPLYIMILLVTEQVWLLV